MRDKNIQAFWDWLMKGAPMVEDWNVNDPLMTPGMLTVWGHWMQYRAEQDPEWVEHLSAAAHQAWMAEKISEGYADHVLRWDCGLVSLNGEPYNAPCMVSVEKHHPDMRPYAELSEAVKEYDRVTVKAVLTALRDFGKETP